MFLSKLRKLLTSKDNKPVMVSFVLARDSCSRLLSEFNEEDLPDTENLVIVWQKSSGELGVASSSNTPVAQVIGMLVLAQGLVGGDENG